MQKVLLVGYLGRDPEVRYSQQGTAVAQFPVAVTERWKDKSGQLQEHRVVCCENVRSPGRDHQ
jgi:single-strand DNA-binding protein